MKFRNSFLVPCLCAVLGCVSLPSGFGSAVGSAEAATLTADRNTESDWDHNNVYQCIGWAASSRSLAR